MSERISDFRYGSVLVVEDDMSCLLILETMLQSWGYSGIYYINVLFFSVSIYARVVRFCVTL